MKRVLMIYDSYTKATLAFQKLAEALSTSDKDFSVFRRELRIVNLSNDSIHQFGAVACTGDSLRYGGLMVNEIIFDEASQFFASDIDYLMARVRYVP